MRNRIFITLCWLILAFISTGCSLLRNESSATGQLSKEERKIIEAAVDSATYAEAAAALMRHDFVIEADRLVSKRGHTAYVNSATNFVSLSGNDAVVQVAPFNSGGPNGVGGITLNGKASDVQIKIDKNKKGNYILTMNVSGIALSATVAIHMPKDSNYAEVYISPNLNSRKITLSGRLIPTEVSNVFKGTSI